MSMLRPISFSLFATATLLFAAPALRAQHVSLLETFTNECYKILANNEPRQTFENNVASTVSAKQSKVILMNYHYGNICDLADYHLTNGLVDRIWPGGTDQILWASVDRAEYSSGDRHSSNPTDWAKKIDADAAAAPVANLSLTDLKIDTVTLEKSRFDIVQAELDVTLNQTISDSIILRFAVLQNDFPDHDNTPDSVPVNSRVNDVVRFLTFDDSGVYAVFTPGSTSGTKKHVVARFVLPSANSTSYSVPWDYVNNRLIGFLEEDPSDNFHVVNAATLKTGMANLPQPDPFLAINSESLDGQVYNVGDDAASFAWSGLQTPLIDVYLSTDNGDTWMVIDTVGTGSTGFPSLAFWTVPNTPTTEAKIKITRHGDQMSAIESGTFTIQAGAFVKWVKPNPNNLDSALAKTTYTLQWTSSGVAAVDVRYSVHTIGTPKWIYARKNFAGTESLMTLPDTSAFLDFQIIPTNGEAASELVQLKVYRVLDVGAVKYSAIAKDFAIRDIYPNPASNSQNIVIDFTSEKPKTLTVDVLDLLGHSIYSKAVMSEPAGQITLPTAQLAAGAYFVRISDGAEAITKRIEIVK
jgi:hypothetical protein